MTESIKVKAKDMKGIIKATFPQYRKRDVYVKATSTVTFYDLNWSGGSKCEYRACSIDGRALDGGKQLGTRAPWDNPFEGKKIDIPHGFVVVEGGWFCGKESTLRINVNPADMPKLITA